MFLFSLLSPTPPYHPSPSLKSWSVSFNCCWYVYNYMLLSIFSVACKYLISVLVSQYGYFKISQGVIYGEDYYPYLRVLISLKFFTQGWGPLEISSLHLKMSIRIHLVQIFFWQRDHRCSFLSTSRKHTLPAHLLVL